MSQGGPNSSSGSGGLVVETFTGNSGGAVGPDAAFNIDLLGNNTTGINIVGTPASNLVTVIGLASSTTQVGTVELATAIETGTLTDSTRAITPSSLAPILVTPYVVAPGGAYTTIQSALNAAGASGNPSMVYVQPGTYTENLTFPNVGITLKADEGGLTTIIGVHTPSPTSPATIDGFVLVSATDIFNSTAAGSSSLQIFNGFIVITNGFLFNIPNWTGFISVDNIGQGSTNDGVVNNSTGSAIIKFINSEVGAGSLNTFSVAGSNQVRLDTCLINCPANFSGTGDIIFQAFVRFRNTLTLAGSRNGLIEDTFFDTGANQALIMSSSANITLVNCSINSSNNPSIGGAGGGTLTLSNVSFLNNAAIAGTLTLGSSSVYPVDMSNGQLLIGSAGQPAVASTLTAGTNISITNGAGTITIDANGGGVLAVTALTTASSPYAVLSTDEYLSCDVSGGILTIQLPNAPTTGRVVRIKDSGGDATTNNISVTTVGGVVTIDGSTTFTMNTNYESISVLFNGTSYEVF